MNYLILLNFLLSFHTPERNLCSCLPVTVSQGIAMSKVVFKGTVVKIDPANMQFEINPDTTAEGRFRRSMPVKLVQFKVSRIYKGIIITEHALLYTSDNSAACGYQFEMNTEYLVYADSARLTTIKQVGEGKFINESMDCLNTSLCSRTTSRVDYEEQYLLQELKKLNAHGRILK